MTQLIESDVSLASNAPRREARGNVVEIGPVGRWTSLNPRDLWNFRDLLFFLAWRDIKVRYRQTLLGAAWVVLQPLLTTVVFTIFFGRLAGMPSDGVPYMLWSLTGLIPWTYFSYVLTQASNSLISNQNLLKKVYFPRLLIPLSCCLDGLVDLAVVGILLTVLLIWNGIVITPAIALLPLIVAVVIATALGCGLWLAALNVRYRDVRYLVPFVTQFLMFVSPVVYPISIVPEYATLGGVVVPARMLYGLNPLAGIVEGFRYAIFGVGGFTGTLFLTSMVMGALLLASGLLYFSKTEREMADII